MAFWEFSTFNPQTFHIYQGGLVDKEQAFTCNFSRGTQIYPLVTTTALIKRNLGSNEPLVYNQSQRSRQAGEI